MSIVFKADDHSYTSTEGEESIKWTSVTSLISKLKKPFDKVKVAARCSKQKKSKWFGIAPEKILQIWDSEALRATSLGTFYHNQRESDLCSLSSLEVDGVIIPIITPVPEVNNLKYAPSQKLEQGVYPEHMVYLKSAGICGQSDLVEVVNDRINIIDYKTNKKIDVESYKDWDGISDKLQEPVSHLDDCNFNHYALQLSIYMYIMLKHNPKLKPGKLFIHHVTFDLDGVDEWGYPITKYTDQGDPEIKQVIPMEIPYLKEEVIAIIKSL